MKFFTADLHFGHANIIKYCNRPFVSVLDMNDGLIDRWNARVSPSDEVYVLGDFSLGTSQLELRKRLNGIVFLVPGNHDKCHQVFHKNKPEKFHAVTTKYYDAGFIVLPEQLDLSLSDDVRVRLCHLPYKGIDEEGLQKFRLEPSEERALLCGHVHQSWKTLNHNNYPIQVNVGVDVWDYAPVSESEILEVIRG